MNTNEIVQFPHYLKEESVTLPGGETANCCPVITDPEICHLLDYQPGVHDIKRAMYPVNQESGNQGLITIAELYQLIKPKPDLFARWLGKLELEDSATDTLIGHVVANGLAKQCGFTIGRRCDSKSKWIFYLVRYERPVCFREYQSV